MWKPADNRPDMTPSEHQVWREFIEKRCGIDLGETRLSFLSRRLWERMRALGIKSYGEYYTYVSFNRNREDEWRELAEILVTNETSFFRHLPTFQALAEHLLPALTTDRGKENRYGLNVWSAACSTGEEAYSMAMVLAETLDARTWRFNVFGTDISGRVLEKARRAEYKPSALRTVPAPYRKYFSTVGRGAETAHRVVDAIRSVARFEYANLIEPETIGIPNQDIVFCQNLLIYFRPEGRLNVIRNLYDKLNPKGYLVLAPGEIVGLKPEGMRPVKIEECLVYQRK